MNVFRAKIARDIKINTKAASDIHGMAPQSTTIGPPLSLSLTFMHTTASVMNAMVMNFMFTTASVRLRVSMTPLGAIRRERIVQIKEMPAHMGWNKKGDVSDCLRNGPDVGSALLAIIRYGTEYPIECAEHSLVLTSQYPNTPNRKSPKRGDVGVELERARRLICGM